MGNEAATVGDDERVSGQPDRETSEYLTDTSERKICNSNSFPPGVQQSALLREEVWGQSLILRGSVCAADHGGSGMETGHMPHLWSHQEVNRVDVPRILRWGREGKFFVFRRLASARAYPTNVSSVTRNRTPRVIGQ